MAQKLKWWEDAVLRSPELYSRNGNKAIDSVTMTGAGPDGVVQPNKPAELLRRKNGMFTTHEGEARVENKDGTMSVIPQNELSEIEKRFRLRGFQTGTSALTDRPSNIAVGGLGSYGRFNVDQAVEESKNNLTNQTLRSNTNAGLVNEYAGTPLSYAQFSQAGALNEGLGVGAQNNIISADKASAAGTPPVTTQQEGTTDSGYGPPPEEITDEGRLAKLDTYIDTLGGLADRVTELGSKSILETSREVYDTISDSAHNKYISLAEKNLADISNGNSEAFEKIAAATLGKATAALSADNLSTLMHSATNPYLTGGAKVALQAELARNNGVVLSDISSELAINAQQKIFDATTALGTLAVQGKNADTQAWTTALNTGADQIQQEINSLVSAGTITADQAGIAYNQLDASIRIQADNIQNSMQYQRDLATDANAKAEIANAQDEIWRGMYDTQVSNVTGLLRANMQNVPGGVDADLDTFLANVPGLEQMLDSLWKSMVGSSGEPFDINNPAHRTWAEQTVRDLGRSDSQVTLDAMEADPYSYYNGLSPEEQTIFKNEIVPALNGHLLLGGTPPTFEVDENGKPTGKWSFTDANGVIFSSDNPAGELPPDGDGEGEQDPNISTVTNSDGGATSVDTTTGVTTIKSASNELMWSGTAEDVSGLDPTSPQGASSLKKILTGDKNSTVYKEAISTITTALKTNPLGVDKELLNNPDVQTALLNDPNVTDMGAVDDIVNAPLHSTGKRRSTRWSWPSSFGRDGNTIVKINGQLVLVSKPSTSSTRTRNNMTYTLTNLSSENNNTFKVTSWRERGVRVEDGISYGNYVGDNWDTFING